MTFFAILVAAVVLADLVIDKICSICCDTAMMDLLDTGKYDVFFEPGMVTIQGPSLGMRWYGKTLREAMNNMLMSERRRIAR